MNLKTKIQNEIVVQMALAPEYARLSRSFWAQYESNRRDGGALVKSIEYKFKSEAAYDKIKWLQDWLGEVSK